LEFQILLSGHVWVEGRGFHHGAHPTPGSVKGLFPRSCSIQGVVPGGGFLQAADHPDEGGLARAIFTNQAVNGSFGHVNIHILQGSEAPVALAKLIGLQHSFHV